MWMFFIDTCLGFCPSGNDGAAHITYKSERWRRKFAESWKGNRHGAVYGMASWTQQMSELGPIAFARYIQEHGTRYA